MEHRILYVEDHVIVRQAVRDWISGFFPSFSSLEARTGEEAIQVVDDKRPDVVIMDIGLPDMSGIEAVRRIKSIHPSTHVIMLTVHDNIEFQTDSQNAGASGYVVKDKAASELIPLLNRLLSEDDNEHLCVVEDKAGCCE